MDFGLASGYSKIMGTRILWKARLALLLAATPWSVSPLFAADAVPLFNGRDVTGWRQPAGDWQSARKVALDPANPKKFLLEGGTGVLVNGPAG